MCTRHASNNKLKIFQKIKMLNFLSPRCPPPFTVQSMDVLLHVENGRPKRPNTDNCGTYVQDGLRPSLSGSPLEDFFTSRMGRISYGHRDIQGIDDGWECATRVNSKADLTVGIS